MKTTKARDARSKHDAACDNSLPEAELSKLIKMKEQEVKQLKQKAEKLCQVEVLCQREKEFLLDQYKQVFGKAEYVAVRDDLSTITEPVSEINTGNRLHDEVHKLVRQIDQQKQENRKLAYQICEMEAVKEMKNIYNYMSNQIQGESIYPESLLQKWLKIINSQRNHSVQTLPGPKVSLTDKLFYNVKYQVCPHKDLVHASVLPGQTSQVRPLPGHLLEMVSFDTRHSGVCVGVMIARVQDEKSSCTGSQLPNLLTSEYIITTNPYIDNSQDAIDFIHQCRPAEFVQQVVWKYIDTITY